MKVFYALVLVLSCQVSMGVRLLRRELSDYPLAKCNDGSTAVYFHDQDVRQAGQRVLIYLPGSGHCSSLDDCKKRCDESGSSAELCTASKQNVLELDDGLWSANSDDNTFSDHFKVYIHSCSSDDFSGTRSASRLTGNRYFHGKHILTSVLQDLVSTFGINSAQSLVLAGSGSGARGVGYNCDYVRDAITAVNSDIDVRCILDGPDLVPWWVKTEPKSCKGQDYNSMEQEHYMWGKETDQSCVTEAEKTVNTSELYHKCGVFSRFWEHVTTPFFLISSQYDPHYFDQSPCGPSESDPQFAAYQLSWRRGVIALLQVIQDRRSDVGIFSANCDSHSLLSGVLAQPYWSHLTVPLLDNQEQEVSLSDLLRQWKLSDSVQAIDSIMRNNTKCVSAAPHRVFGSCTGRLVTCNSHATLLPSVISRSGHGFNRGLIRRLSPPSYIWPASYNQHRRCGLDHFYSGCGAESTFGIGSSGCTSCSSGCSGGCGHGAGTFLSSADRVVPESAIPAAGTKGRLWRRFYYLQYLKLLYNKLKAEYAREYYLATRHGHSSLGHSVGKVFSSIKAPTDIVDYYDDYYGDYDYSDDVFARIVKAVKNNKEKQRKAGSIDPRKILLESVQKNFVFPQELLDSLPDIDDIEYEDFKSITDQVESFNTVRRKKNLIKA